MHLKEHSNHEKSRRTGAPRLYHPAYIIVPGGNSMPYVAPNSQVRRRAEFVNSHFRATRYHEDELSAAGTLPEPKLRRRRSAALGREQRVTGRPGCRRLVHARRHAHSAPGGLADHAGDARFKLIPGGFFTRNPALDVPSSWRSDKRSVYEELDRTVGVVGRREHFNLVEKKRWLDEQVGANPFVDRADLRAYTDKNERAFLDQLAKERSGGFE